MMVEPDVVRGIQFPAGPCQEKLVFADGGSRRTCLGKSVGGAPVVGAAGAGERVGLPGAGVAQVVDHREPWAAGGPGDAQPLAAGVERVGGLITHRPRDARWVMRWANPHAVLATPASCALAMPPLMAVPRTTATRRTARRAAVMAAPVHRDEVITEQAGLTGPNVHSGPVPAQPERYPALGGMNRREVPEAKCRKTPACGSRSGISPRCRTRCAVSARYWAASGRMADAPRACLRSRGGATR